MLFSIWMQHLDGFLPSLGEDKGVLALGREDRSHEGRRNGALVGEGAFEDS
jgi:hypothetical protein